MVAGWQDNSVTNSWINIFVERFVRVHNIIAVAVYHKLISGGKIAKNIDVHILPALVHVYIHRMNVLRSWYYGYHPTKNLNRYSQHYIQFYEIFSLNQVPCRSICNVSCMLAFKYIVFIASNISSFISYSLFTQAIKILVVISNIIIIIIKVVCGLQSCTRTLVLMVIN